MANACLTSLRSGGVFSCAMKKEINDWGEENTFKKTGATIGVDRQLETLSFRRRPHGRRRVWDEMGY